MQYYSCWLQLFVERIYTLSGRFQKVSYEQLQNGNSVWFWDSDGFADDDVHAHWLIGHYTITKEEATCAA